MAADPFTASAPGQRYAVYAELARSGSAHRITLPTGAPAWLITGRDDVRRLLTDRRVVKGPLSAGPMADRMPLDVRAAAASNLVYRNPPDHTRLRGLVSATFTRRRVDQLAPRIREIADQLLDALSEVGEVDLITGYAYPLPVAVVCELLGIPDVDRAAFRRWSSAMMIGNYAGVDTYVAATTEMHAYVRRLIADKRSKPTDDLITALTIARDGGDRLTEDELVGTIVTLVIAGHETTANLIGNGVHALLTHPHQLALLRAEPHRLSGALEELLRFAPPLQLSPPYLTAEPVRVGAVTIPAGEVVVLGLLAANRAPGWIADPARLDITRDEVHHIAFGHGIHHCPGAPLARLEGKIALGALLARFPRLRLAVPAGELTWPPQMLAHGLASLPVLLR
ncbi:cytochrome P450 [Pseudonocardia eucalypti]|uniref:Cytochrome P450 n=1 Tax=Pseudonocardia eucalypti TaxID=648755 RepID=A0ABP9QCK0_9PSEU|nr:cytochrome P450 [Pseudonocardia eucalypti]